MKQVKNKMLNYLKLGIFLFTISFSLSNCKKDENTIIEHELDINRFQKEIKSISELSKNSIFKEKLKSVRQNEFNNKARRMSDEFEIDTTSIIHLFYDNYDSYTFNLNKNTAEYRTEYKLVIETNSLEAISRAKIVTVKYEILENKELHRTITAKIIDLSQEETNNLISARAIIECENVLVDVEGHDCESGDHSPGESCDEGYSGFPAEYGYAYYEEVCTEYYSNMPGGTFEGPSGIGLGGIGGIGMPNNWDFISYMGWTLQDNGASFLWFMKERNSKVASLLSNMQTHNNTAISTTQYNNVVTQLMSSGYILDNTTYWDLSMYLEYQNYSIEACQFVVEALEAVCNGGSVDLPNNVILDATFTAYPTAECIYDILKNSSSFKQMFTDAFGGSDAVNVTLKVLPLSNPNLFAYTEATVGSIKNQEIV